LVIRSLIKNLDKAGAYLKGPCTCKAHGVFLSHIRLSERGQMRENVHRNWESSGMLLHLTMAYGVLVRAAIEIEDIKTQAKRLRFYFLSMPTSL